MRKITLFLILILFAAAGYYYFAGTPSGTIVKRWVSREQPSGRGQELNTKGVEELNDGRPVEAAGSLREAARLEPENRIIARNLSVALARVAQLDGTSEGDALDLIDESLQLWPRNPETLDAAATIHYRAARYGEALKYARVLQEMMPDRRDLGEYVTHLETRASRERGMVSETGDYFRLLYSGERKLEYEGEVLALLQTEMDSLTAELSVFPEEPIDVLILTEDLGERAEPLDPFMDGLYDGQIRLYLGEGVLDRKKLVVTVRHEMVHALLHRAAGSLPSWVQEGVAQKVGENPGEEHLNAVRGYLVRAVGEGHRVDLASMDSTFLDLTGEKRTRAYATSLLFMDYLVRTYGRNFMPLFVSELTDGAPPMGAVQEVTGRSLEELLRSFVEDLEREG